MVSSDLITTTFTCESMPSDEDGHLGRQCPECSGIWRMHAEDYRALPDDPRLWCVYCGHEDDNSQFITNSSSTGQCGRLVISECSWCRKLWTVLFVRYVARHALLSSLLSTGPSRSPQPDFPALAKSGSYVNAPVAGAPLAMPFSRSTGTAPVCGQLTPDVVAFDALDAGTAMVPLAAARAW